MTQFQGDQYSVIVTHAARRSLARLPRGVQARSIEAIDALGLNPRPRGVRMLQEQRGRWRARVGDYRIVYEIQDAERKVLIVRIGHRRDVYRGLEDV